MVKESDIKKGAPSGPGLESSLAREYPPSLADRINWDKPRVLWHQGTHFGLLRTSEGKEVVRAMLRPSGMV